MPKSKRPAVMEAASSGSDDDDSSSSSDDSSSSVSVSSGDSSSSSSSHEQEAVTRNNDATREDEDDDSSSSSSSSDGEEEESDDDDDNHEEQHPQDDDDDDVTTSALSLDQRLAQQAQEGVGSQLSVVRARKAKALQVAAQRIAKLKKTTQTQQHSKDDESSDSSDDGDDDDKPELSSSSKTNDSTSKLLHSKNNSKRSKHKPTEVSSKRSDFFKRGARNLNESGIGVEIGAHRYKPLDPRMSSLSGHLNEDQFDQNYDFVNEIRAKEIARLKKCVQAYKVSGRKGKDMRRKLNITGGSLEEYQDKLQTLQAEKANQDRLKLERAAKRVVKKKIREEVAEGKRGVYFLKRKEQKRLELEAKFEELRKRGGDRAVDKLVAKKRRKNKSRDAGLFAK